MTFNLNRRARLAAFAVAAAASLGTNGAPMAGDQPLDEPLVIRITQMGFAGETGTEYVIEPNGRWQARRFVNERTTEELGQGMLPSAAMIALAHEVQAARLDQAQAAVETVNAAFVDLRLGESRAVAPLADGSSLAGDCPAPEGSPECGYLALARSVEAKLAE